MTASAVRRSRPPLPPVDAPAAIGLKVDDYLVTRRIGEGGMGVVYEALHPVIGKKVAIKVLRPDRASDPNAVAEIISEARAVSAVHHRGVVDIYNVGQLPDGRAYLVMELLTGQPLDAWLAAHGPVPIAEVLGYIAEILEAVAAVHQAGLLHRDLKLANVFRVEPSSGAPYLKLVDFGLARTVAPTPHELVAGTPGYMAPEQLRGGAATVATDLYAAGVMAYELASGTKAIANEPVAALQAQEARLAAARRIKPAELGSLLGRLLSIEPTSRPASAHAALEAVQRLQVAGPASTGSWSQRIVELVRGFLAPARSFAPPVPPPSEPKHAEGEAVPRPTAAENPTLEITLGDIEAIEPVAPAYVDPAQLARLTDAALSHLVTMERLPSFPVTALRLVHLLQRSQPEAAELTRLVSQDSALAAQVLRRANSAFSSRGVEITTVREAVVRLGLVEVSEVAAASATWSLYQRSSAKASPALLAVQRRLATQALSSAFGAAWLAMECRQGDSERAFMGGLLHDIGKTLVVSALGDPALAAQLGDFDAGAQLEPLLEILHIDLGALMAEEWKLPAYVVRICKAHHAPALDPSAPIEVHLVRLTSAVVDMKLNPGFPSVRLDEVRESGQALGLDRFQLRAASSQIGDLVTKAQRLVRETGV